MIGILLDGSVAYGDRLESALFHIACDLAEDEDLVEDCGEGFGKYSVEEVVLITSFFPGFPVACN